METETTVTAEGAIVTVYSGSCWCPGDMLEQGQHFPECTDKEWTK